MFNDYLANEAAKKHIERHEQEANAFRQHRRIEADNSKTMQRTALALIALVGLVLAFAPFI